MAARVRALCLAVTTLAVSALLFLPRPPCDIRLSCENVAFIFVVKHQGWYVAKNEEGEDAIYLVNVLLRQKKINLRREFQYCGGDVATLWAGDTPIFRYEPRAMPKREVQLTADSFSYGWDSLQLARATEDEAFALARAICAKKTDPELRP